MKGYFGDLIKRQLGRQSRHVWVWKQVKCRCVQRKIEGVEVKKAITRLKCGKVLPIDGIPLEMFNIFGLQQ